MRGLLLTAAAALVLSLGLGCRSDNRYDQAYYYQQSAPRVNLYPLTSPPAGTVQPVRGYGPTQVSQTRDYYGQSNYAGYANPGYYSGQPAYGTYQTAGYNPGYNYNYNASYNTGYNTGGTYTAGYTGGYGAGYTGYGVSQDPFPAGTIGQQMGQGIVANPFNPGGGYCRVEDVTPYMNPVVPIMDPPVVIGENINLGNTGPSSYPAGYYNQPISYNANATTQSSSTAGYSTGSAYTTGTYNAPAVLSSTVVASSNVNYDSGPVPYCGPNVSCPPDPRVDTSMYGGTTVLPAPQAQTASGGNYGGYTTDSFGLVGAGYAGGAYPSIIDTVPATYDDASENLSRAFQGPMNMGGIRLVPARDMRPNFRPSDAAPSQWYEIIRPGNGPVQIGRVTASCVCIGVRVPKRQIAAGERAFIEARVLTRPPVSNLTYGIFVNIVDPVKTVVDADVTISY